MLNYIQITTRGPAPWGRGYQSAFNEAMRTGWRRAGRVWLHEGPRELHFQPSALYRYGYTPRTPAYEKKKYAKHGHKNPLMFSGTSFARSAAGTVRATATSARSQLRVTLNTPALNYIPKGGRINMREEITAQNPADLNLMAEGHALAFEVSLATAALEKVVKIKR